MAEGEVRRVLVCDDERHMVRLIQVNLERQDCSVTCVYGGQEAVVMLAKEPFDLLILDLHMPCGMNGCEVLAHIRTNEAIKNTLVWMLAAEEEATVYSPCREHRADRYASKPFRFTDLFGRK